jgi:hypothetical protein
MICLGTKFHLANTNGSLFIAMMLKSIENFYMATMLFYVSYQKFNIFLKIYYHTSFQNPILSVSVSHKFMLLPCCY